MNNSAALYLRVSRDDGDKSESESISNQREFLKNYANENEFSIYNYYIDDGYSGTTFDRPQFNNMLSDIKKGNVDIVLTKDLSRLGRDYIMTGYYIEKYFPGQGIRYIAVNDGIDTFIDNGFSDISPFKAVINDMYAKDISKKVRTALMTKKKNGKFIGSLPPYGYKKDPKDKNHLIVDNLLAENVLRIYRLFLEGNSLSKIARVLTNEKILTPSQVKSAAKDEKAVWNETILKRILTNQTYIGNLTQNRSKKLNYKINKRINLSNNEWIVVKNTHEGIIDEKDFNRVQEILSEKRYQRRKSDEHLLSGVVFCGDCGKPMTFQSDGNRKYLVCSTWKKNPKLCKTHCIREDYVKGQVLKSIRQINEKIDKEELVKLILGKYIKEIKGSSEIDRIKLKLNVIGQTFSQLYKDRAMKKIDEDEYFELYSQLRREKRNLQDILKSLEGEVKEVSREEVYKKVQAIIRLNEISNEILKILINKVYIYPNKDITIKFDFSEKCYDTIDR